MGTGFRIVEKKDVSYLDNLLKAEGLVRPLAAINLQLIPFSHLLQWAQFNGVYQFPTLELIDFLRDEIKDQKAIEICAGNGVLSRELGVIGTDSYMQHRKKIRQYYAALNQEITQPSKHVKKYEALEAVRVFRPDVVFGAFVTQFGTAADAMRGIGSGYGVKEWELLEKVKKYILIGNKQTHAGKRIFSTPHKELYFPWLVSRSFDQSLNRIWIWEN